MRRFLFTGALFLLILYPLSLGAMHAVDHRFTVFGYVRNAQGDSLKGKTVIVVHKQGSHKESVITDLSGYYESKIHLHNDNAGDKVGVTVEGGESKEITVSFDPTDTHTERSVQLDFGAPGKATSRSALLWGAGTAAAAVVGYLGFKRRRKTRRLERAERRRMATKKGRHG